MAKDVNSDPSAGNGARFGFRRFMATMVRLLAPNWGQVALIVVAILFQIIFYLAFPFGLQLIFDRAIGENDMRILGFVLAGLGGGFLVSAFAGLGQDYLASRVAASVLSRLRVKMFDHLQSQSNGFFHRNQAGDLMSRFSNDLTSIEAGVVQGLPLGFYQIVLMASSVALLFAVDWRLALATLLASPLMILGPNIFGSRAARLSLEKKERESALATIVQENISGQAVIRAFGLERFRRIYYQERAQNLAESSVRLNLTSALVGRTSNMSVFLLILVIVAVGALLVIRGNLSVGGLLAFLGLLLNVDEGSRGLTLVVPILLQSVGGTARAEGFLSERPEARDAEDAVDLDSFEREIRFREVTFSYVGTEPQIQRVDFSINKGESVAFVGPSGSGKSTIVNLLMRFYDPGEGSVSIDGLDLRSMLRESLRSRIAVVMQESFLFDDSVRENIRAGRLDASDDEVEQAARAAEIHELVLSLPDGYETKTGERGAGLSGGQRQRLAIARALLRDPEILVLDEATSALDPGTESEVNSTLRRIAEDRTVISITHRLAPVASMDRIFVLDRGSLVESGTHDELLARRGAYAGMWSKQSGFALSDDGNNAEVEIARLKEIPLLGELDDGYLTSIANRFITDRHPAGSEILEQGVRGTKFSIIVRGSVDVVTTDSGGAHHHMATLEVGDYFGEIALLSPRPTTASVRARTETVCLALFREQFHHLMTDSPKLRSAIVPMMERRSRAIDAVHQPDQEESERS